MEVLDILKKHSIRATSQRRAILGYFIKSKTALTHAHLEKVFKNQIDRVSIYRMLQLFSDKHILCKIVDSNGGVSYVFDNHSGLQKQHFHPHYKCKACNDVVELPELPLEYMEKLKKLNIDEVSILAEGTCEECEKANENNIIKHNSHIEF